MLLSDELEPIASSFQKCTLICNKDLLTLIWDSSAALTVIIVAFIKISVNLTGWCSSR